MAARTRLVTVLGAAVIAAVASIPFPGAAIGAPATEPAAVTVTGTYVEVDGMDRAVTEDADLRLLRGAERSLLYPTGSMDALPLLSAPRNARSGDRVSVELALPTSTVRLLGLSPGARVQATTSAGARALSSLSSAVRPIRVLDSTTDHPAARDISASVAHRSQIAIVRPVRPRTSTPIAADSDGTSAVVDRIARGEAYWVGQSAGAISAWTESSVQVYDSSLDCSAVNDLWAEAAARFGDPSGSTWFSNRGNHLIVVVPSACAQFSGIGLGTVGGGVGTGGLVFAAYDPGVLTPTIAHELGHNFGLEHAFVRLCDRPLAGIEVGTCARSKYEYLDPYSVMGGAWQGYSQVPALSPTLRRHLHFEPAGSITDMALPADTARVSYDVTLSAAGATGVGTTGLHITDPVSGASYDVSYRDGTGQDSGTAYTSDLPRAVSGGLWTTGRGVTVEQGVETDGALATDRFAVVPYPAGSARTLALDAGQSLSTGQGAISVRVVAVDGSHADVQVVVGTWTRSEEPPAVGRLQGADRYEVAVGIAQAAFPDHADTVFLATGASYPDALSAGPAAAKEGGPLLLTTRDGLPSSTVAELRALRPTTIVIVGGPASVGPGAERAVRSLGWAPTVVRHAFSDAPVATAYVATGANFPDALSAGGAAAARGRPVLLVPGSGSAVDAPTRYALRSLGVTSILIAGGPSSVSPAMASSLAGIAPVTRLSGSDRFEASIAINRDAFSRASDVFVATGLNFPDALAGSVIAGMRGAPLYESPPSCVPPGMLDDVATLGARTVTMLGGSASLSPTGAGQLRSCP